MAYTYYGTSGFIKTGETITVLPSGLIQKKVTVVRQSFKGESLLLSEGEAYSELGGGFFAYPLPSANKQNDGFSQFDIVGYKKGTGGINYKYRKLSSFIIQDQNSPRTMNVSVEVGVRSTIVLSGGTQATTTNGNGDTTLSTVYGNPAQYDGELFAFNESGSAFTKLSNTEIYQYTDPLRTETIYVEYAPITVVESVSSTYYGNFTEYITTSSLKIVRSVISQNITFLE
jgi:hypothetical protein